MSSSKKESTVKIPPSPIEVMKSQYYLASMYGANPVFDGPEEIGIGLFVDIFILFPLALYIASKTNYPDLIFWLSIFGIIFGHLLITFVRMGIKYNKEHPEE